MNSEPPYNFTIPFPPSVNHYWNLIPMGNSARMIVGKRGRAFREEVKVAIGNIQCSLDNLSVKIIAFPPDRRRRDLDNLLKATLDALQHAGVYKDDYQISDLHITRSPELDKEGKLIVSIIKNC